MKLKVFTTGGTIDKIYFDDKSEYEVGDPQARGILQRANVTVDCVFESLFRKDSLDITDEDRALIRKAVESCAERYIVITHGTDTLIDTARALHGVSGKTIVLTGSLYPALFLESDAVFNLASALTAAQVLPEGVYIAMNGRIFDPDAVRKNTELNRFEEVS